MVDFPPPASDTAAGDTSVSDSAGSAPPRGLFNGEAFNPPPDPSLAAQARPYVAQVMHIDAEHFPATPEQQEPGRDMVLLSRESRVIAAYTGIFTVDTEAAWAQLDAQLKPLNLLPVFRERDGQQVAYIVHGRAVPNQGGERLALVLFLLTVLSVMFVGMLQAVFSELASSDQQLADQIARSIAQNPLNAIPELWRGLPYALSILLILGGHEMGHYLMSRRHNTAASLPYFLPFPLSLFGTFGAAIRLREPMRNRKILFDIGVAGPLAGLVFAIPILFIGLATSEVGPLGSGLVEGNSLFYAFAKLVTFGRFLPDGSADVYLNQLAWAGWTGLFVTGLNLIPLGQLDGGHVVYALLGKLAGRLYFPAVVILAILTVITEGALAIMLLLLIFLGRYHAVPLDDLTRLDPARQRVALLALVIFVLVFVPIPLEERVVAEGVRIPTQGAAALTFFSTMALGLWLALGRRLMRPRQGG